MTGKRYFDIRRALTTDEQYARVRVWEARQKGEGITLTAAQVHALHESILQTGRELCALRDAVEMLEAVAGL